MRDDKSFPFILLRNDHDFPQVRKHRGRRRPIGDYYGPFASAGSVTRTLNALQKLFLLRSCSDSYFANRDRPCLLYQIRRCSAPCVDRISKEEYAELVADAKLFLAGKSTGVQKKLGEQMAAAAEKQDYELGLSILGDDTNNELLKQELVELKRTRDAQTQNLVRARWMLRGVVAASLIGLVFFSVWISRQNDRNLELKEIAETNEATTIITTSRTASFGRISSLER